MDCTISYYFDEQPLLSIDDGQAPLPAHERLWRASDAETWVKLSSQSKGANTKSIYLSDRLTIIVNDSLCGALQILYIEKRLVSDAGWFNQTLLAHALYQRMEEVGGYFRRPLSFWNPSAKRQARETAIPSGSVWLPGIPSFSKWRNSTCDCLDILDWTAKSSGVSADSERNLALLDLHLARLVLLAPFRETRSLATSLAMGKLRWSQRQQTTEWQYLWRWIKHDQYKARLSIVHAGATLWLARRSSTRASHEPFAAFLAVLTIWAYGMCHTYDGNRSSSTVWNSRAELPQGSQSIQVDNPCDDEAVEHFVREGHLMRAYIGDVGDICDIEGPKKILRAGQKTLSTTAFGISKRFAMVLNRLADVMP